MSPEFTEKREALKLVLSDPALLQLLVDESSKPILETKKIPVSTKVDMFLVAVTAEDKGLSDNMEVLEAGNLPHEFIDSYLNTLLDTGFQALDKIKDENLRSEFVKAMNSDQQAKIGFLRQLSKEVV